ncbi:Dihydrolipoamide acetyltransferase component of pyruvate dehydrogenase complex [Fusarium oxysporum f. sp. albedinis]|nr:Dihydrolipoamide acetyltransferase component of pyruvate dehydrogenase complex [Fusarium oxysporum f. sp. albedinis]
MTDPLEDKVVETSPPILSPSTLLADAQQLQEERLFRHFRGWLFSERAKDTSSWTWDYGYDMLFILRSSAR